MAIERPIVNGRKYDYSSIEVSILRDGAAAEVFLEINSIEYDDTIEEALMYGTNPAPIGRTRGVYNPGEATLTMSKQSQAVLFDALGDGYYEAQIKIMVKYSDAGLPIVTDTLEQCRLIGGAVSHSQGPDPLMVPVKLKPMIVKRNGKTPLVNHVY